MAALDSDSEVTEVMLGSSSMEELKSRLEVLLGAVPEARTDESQRREREAQAAALAEKREQMAAAGGQLLSAACGFLARMLPATATATPPAPEIVNHIQQQLTDAAEIDEHGRRMLKIALPPDETLRQVAQTLAQLLGLAQTPPAP